MENNENLEVTIDPAAKKILAGGKVITRDAYRDALMSLTKDEEKSGSIGAFLSAMTAVMVGKEIEERLFGEEDSIVITEDELVLQVFDSCRPDTLLKTKQPRSVSEMLHISISALIGLETFIIKLFK